MLKMRYLIGEARRHSHEQNHTLSVGNEWVDHSTRPPLSLLELGGFPAIGEAGDPRSSAVKLRESEGGMRDAMRITVNGRYLLPASA